MLTKFVHSVFKIFYMVKTLSVFVSVFIGSVLLLKGQETEVIIKSIFDEALNSKTAYNNLETLCKKYNGRVTGSERANAAVDFTFGLMKDMDMDRVEKQPVLVPRWVRGQKEVASIQSKAKGTVPVEVTALGMSIGTGRRGLKAKVVEVHSFEELNKLGSKNLKGKIVFFNRPMDPNMVNTFAAYGSASNQRTLGAAEAAKYGANGVVVRSLTTVENDYPHTGVLRYVDTIPKIPAVAISTIGANLLSATLKEDPNLDFYFKTTSSTEPNVISYNVISEIKGSVYPEQIITVGGHLDTWDLGEGAHDDGAGCMQSIEVLRLFQKLGIQPKRTIRAVMFMDEEVGQTGGKEYAKQALLKKENHYFALEADRGAFKPKGFGISISDDRFEKIKNLQKYFEPYEITHFAKGGGGVDIGPLAQFGTPLSSYIPEMEHYFDLHHSGLDTFEQIDFNEFQMGSAAIASFIYLIDYFDL